MLGKVAFKAIKICVKNQQTFAQRAFQSTQTALQTLAVLVVR